MIILRKLGLVGPADSAAPAAAERIAAAAEEPAIDAEEPAIPAPTPSAEGPQHNAANASSTITIATQHSPATQPTLPDPCAASPVSEISGTSGSYADMEMRECGWGNCISARCSLTATALAIAVAVRPCRCIDTHDCCTGRWR